MVFATTFLLVGCYSHEEPATVDESSQSPQPRQKAEKPKTKAELLVGKWKLVKVTPPPNPPYEATFEFTERNEVTIWFHFPFANPNIPQEIRGPGVRKGTYQLTGNKLKTLIDLGIGPPGPTSNEMTITTLTEDKMVTSGWSGGTKMIYEDVRVREKK